MHRSRTAAVIASLLVLSLALAACGGSVASEPAADASESAPASESAEAGGGDTVSLAGGTFSPGSLTVAAGTTVTFTDTGGHTVTEGLNGTAADDPILDETGGADIEVTLDEPGTYPITCRIHPNMNMTVTVEG